MPLRRGDCTWTLSPGVAAVSLSDPARSRAICPSCGFRNAVDAELCESCGFDFSGATQQREVLPLPPSPDGPAVLEGKWELLEEVGRGGMGHVHLARDIRLDRTVAVKMLAPAIREHPELIQRFEREARLLARLEHPNLVPIYAVGQTEGLPFIVMKALQGQSLHDLVATKGPLGVQQVVPLLRQICAGLQFLHDRNVIHRDVKPSNVFVGEDGHVTLLDLGLATDFQDQTLTRTGMVLGTPAYMSPEQIRKATEVDNRSDLYSVACVLFEVLTGSPPFGGESDFSIMQAQISEPAPDPRTLRPQLPDAVVRVLLTALSKDPVSRYPTANDLFAAFEAAVSRSPTIALPRPANLAPKPQRRAARRRPWFLVAGIAAVGLVVLVTALVTSTSPRPVKEPEPGPVLTPVQPPIEPEKSPPVVETPVHDAQLVEPAEKKDPPPDRTSTQKKRTPPKVAAPTKVDVRVSVVSGNKPVFGFIDVDGLRQSGRVPGTVTLTVGTHELKVWPDSGPAYTERVEVTPATTKLVLRRPE